MVWTFIKSNGGEKVTVYAIVNLVNIAIYVIVFYVLKHIQIPYILNKGRWFLFLSSVVLFSMLMFLLWRINGVLWMDEFRDLKGYPFFNWVNYAVNAIQFYSPAVVLLLWDLLLKQREEHDRMLELEKQKLNTELKYLKAQLNPHFLFNTLNNLYSQVLLNSSKAPDMILQLSGILDYVLYRSQEERVHLYEEVEIIKHFLSLEEIRYGERLVVGFNTSGSLDIEIAPLLFLSLVENAFKHGVRMDSKKSSVEIAISRSERLVSCSVVNSKGTAYAKQDNENNKGIGLNNIKRQLKLIYPDSHKIEIEDVDDFYRVTVYLEL